MSQPLLDKQEIALLGTGFVLGCVLMAVLTGIGLAIGLTPSIEFGIPLQ